MEGHVNMEDKGVSIIVSTSKYDFANNIFDNYKKQNFRKKELIIVVRNDDEDFFQWVYRSEEYPMTRVYQMDNSKSLNECINYGIEQSIFDYIAVFDENSHYDSDYLSKSITELDKGNVKACNQLFKKIFP